MSVLSSRRCAGMVGLLLGTSLLLHPGRAAAQQDAVEVQPLAGLPPLTVSISANRPVALYNDWGEHDELQPLLTIPASEGKRPSVVTTLPAAGLLRVGGPGVVSGTFRLPIGGAVHVDIVAAPRALENTGTALLVVGGILGGVGLLTLAAGGLTLNSERSAAVVSPPGLLTSGTQILIGGGVLVGAGVISLIVGGVTRTRMQTRVTVSAAAGADVGRAPGGELPAPPLSPTSSAAPPQ